MSKVGDHEAEIRPLVGGGWEYRIRRWIDDPEAEEYAISSTGPFLRQETVEGGMARDEEQARRLASAWLRKYELESPAGDWVSL